MTEDPTFAAIEWSGCPLVQRDPDGGDWPVMKSAPSAPVEGLIVNYLDGESIEDVAYMFEVDLEEVRAIIRYYLDRAPC
jgi:hypothetical protein